jgi:hypothetical protein
MRDHWSPFLDRAEQHHRWVIEQVEELDTPLLVCEPVLAEAMYLLARFPKAQDALFGLIENDSLKEDLENRVLDFDRAAAIEAAVLASHAAKEGAAGGYA